MKWAANLSWLYTEWPFEERLAAAAENGFKAIECMFPYAHDAQRLKALAEEHGLKWVLINAPAGHWDEGDRGLACRSNRRDEFKRSMEAALQYANVLGVNWVHVLAGAVDEVMDPDAERTAWDTYKENLQWLADQTKNENITWLIEPINRRDIPGYLLHGQEQAHALLEELNCANLGVQMDLYHCQVAQGDVVRRLQQYLPTGRVKHIQIAGAPDRHEPDQGELNYVFVMQALKQLNYRGHIGLEYRPRQGTRKGLEWVQKAAFSGTM
jgi:2-dehydrotetronate isomerase